MKSSLVLVALSVASLFVGCSALVGEPYVWPQPASISYTGSWINISSTFAFTTINHSPILRAAMDRFTQQMFGVHGMPQGKGQVGYVMLQLISEDETLQQSTDESYKLVVQPDGTFVRAQTVYGALHALETLSQLIQYDFDGHVYTVPTAKILDTPRFAYRGLLVDTSRHYEPIRVLRQIVDSMSYAKLNVFHWHAVDAQSFPLEIDAFPLLNKGAYNPNARYSRQEMTDLVEYARMRGVRVMIEFDGPGHAYSWGVGYPQLLPTNWNQTQDCSNECPTARCNVPLDPSNPFTYEVLKGVYAEMSGGQLGGGIFPETFMHLGGDEVEKGCWSLSPEIAAFMKSHNYTDLDQMYEYFVTQAHAIALSTDVQREPVAWEEVFNHFGTALDKRSIIHVWLSAATVAKVVGAGYRAIYSVDGQWYLDGLGTTWEYMYSIEPLTNITDPKEQSLVIGGEACMWGETADASDILQTIWPRAAAVAERLWSPQDVTDPSAAAPRYAWFRCLLNDRGVPAAPSSQGGRGFPTGPGDCLQQ